LTAGQGQASYKVGTPRRRDDDDDDEDPRSTAQAALEDHLYEPRALG